MLSALPRCSAEGWPESRWCLRGGTRPRAFAVPPPAGAVEVGTLMSIWAVNWAIHTPDLVPDGQVGVVTPGELRG